MKDPILVFLHALQQWEQLNEEAEEWQFTHGSACGVCTHSAMLVAWAFNGVVLGYYAKDNPRAQIGMTYSQGHDFTVIADRWLADHWAWRATGPLEMPIMDLAMARDRFRAFRLYGPRRFWSLVWSARSPETSNGSPLALQKTLRRTTALYLDSGQAPSPDFVMEECTSAADAQHLADHFARMISLPLAQEAEQDRQ